MEMDTVLPFPLSRPWRYPVHAKLLSSVPSVGAAVVRPHMIQLKFSEQLTGLNTGADVVTSAMWPMPGFAAGLIV